jgi:outer membrane protein assembly factor BamE (lipoprotein component of BamABCDE complex)
MAWRRAASGARQMANNSIAGVALAAAIAATMSCAYGHQQPEVVAGRPFPTTVVAKLVVGNSTAEVRRLLGEPLSVKPNAGGEVWLYRYETRQEESIKLLGFIPWPAKERRCAAQATLTFREDRLMSVDTNPR